jgi:hypothetical protein
MMRKAMIALSLLCAVGCGTQKDPVTLATGSKAMVIGYKDTTTAWAKEIDGDDFFIHLGVDAGTNVVIVGDGKPEAGIGDPIFPVKFLDGKFEGKIGHMRSSSLKPMP